MEINLFTNMNHINPHSVVYLEINNPLQHNHYRVICNSKDLTKV